MRVTIAMLVSRIDHLNQLTGNPRETWTVTKDKNGVRSHKANIGNYHLSQAYGGVSLHQICTEGGGVKTPIGSYHMPKRELLDKINAYINGYRDAKD